MMNTLRTLWSQITEALNASRRFYKLDDTYAVHVSVEPSGFNGDHLRAALSIHERTPAQPEDNGTVYWDGIDLETLPARLLGRVAEYKVLVERYNANELDEFPASTMENFLEPQEAQRAERYMTRRRRR